MKHIGWMYVYIYENLFGLPTKEKIAHFFLLKTIHFNLNDFFLDFSTQAIFIVFFYFIFASRQKKIIGWFASNPFIKKITNKKRPLENSNNYWTIVNWQKIQVVAKSHIYGGERMRRTFQEPITHSHLKLDSLTLPAFSLSLHA